MMVNERQNYMKTSFDEMIGLQSNKMNKKMLRYLNRSLEWYELTLEQWVVLSTLAEQENINQKMLSLKIEKDPASLLRILDILEKKGFIERRQVQGDRRLKNEVAPYIENRFKEITADIPENEIEIYEQVLGKIDRSLDALLDKHKY